MNSKHTPLGDLEPIAGELLAALKLALPWAEKVAATSPTQDAGIARARAAAKAVAAARAAIAKAEASSPEAS